MSQPSENATRIVSVQELEKQKEYSNLVAELISSKYADNAKAFVHTYGCQGNVADGERIEGMLVEMGYVLTDDVNEADLVLFNTCAIREHAEDRLYGNVGALKILKKTNPELRIVLCGCMMQQKHAAEKIKKSYPFVDIVFGTHALYRLPEMLYNNFCTGKRVFEISDEAGVIAEDLPVHRDSSFKAWLPIMYGCNNFCSYCVVPYVRGRERSRNPQDVIEEAKCLVKQGYKDITLLGQNVNSYGKGTDYNFARLLREINDIDGDFLIRFMTSHPKDCTFELLDTMAQCDKVAKHLHLPFQSGNNRVLKEMNRGYTREKYLELLDYAYKVMPDLSVTADVIVGFPGETYAEFLDTVSLVEKAEFTSMYTFIFSSRPGTKAATMQDTVSREEKGKWFDELLKAQERAADKRTSSMVGKTYRVLCEEMNKKGLIEGRTQGNVIIEFPGSNELIGTFANVKVTESLIWILKGELQ